MEDQLINSFDNLNVEGKNIKEGQVDLTDYKLVNKLIDLVLNKKRNILLYGPGGVGKSYLLTKNLKQEIERREQDISFTSTTGVSALAIGGSTIYRWSGIKLGKESIMTICNRIRNVKDCYKRWTQSGILVIDEISMLGVKIFEVLDLVGKNICDNDLPFGGKQLILSGDFLQLPPVCDNHSFNSEIWTDLDLRIIRMTTPKRYPDVDHFNLLMRIRVGEHTKDDIKKLYSRVTAYIDYVKNGSGKNEMIKPTRIYSLKMDVEKFNLEELSKLPGEVIVYNAVDKFITKKEVNDGKEIKNKSCDKMSGKDIMNYTEYLNSVITRQLYFKPGAQVMLTVNLSVEKGLVNGSRGIIISCEINCIVCLFKNGDVVRIYQHEYSFEEGKIKMIRYQIPLILAWSISTHKVQGASLDYAIIDIGPKVFAPGMAYVSLSRVRTLNGILICSFDPKSLVADPDVLEYEREIIELEKEQDLEYEQDRQNVPDNDRYIFKQTFISNRGRMNGRKVTIEKIPGVNRQLISFIKYDCPEVYEIMSNDEWNLLKNIDVDLEIDNDTLYAKILDVLELENENQPGSSTC